MAGRRGSRSDVANRVFRRYFGLIFVLWIVFVLYPNPLNLGVSIYRLVNFAPDPGAVRTMLDDFPAEPAAIEQAVLEKISYRYDWELYGMPWYVPAVRQVVERGEGDCKARALVLASLLEAKNISYQVHLSPIHVWVSYENKQESSIENTQVEFYRYDPQTGERQFQIPEISVRQVGDSWRQQFWTSMPMGRKILLVSGLLALIAARVVWREKRAI